MVTDHGDTTVSAMSWTAEKIRSIRQPDPPARRPAPVSGWSLYEDIKANFQRQYPGATPAEYERAMRRAAKKVGV